MVLSSPAFEDGEMVPKKYTCEGEDINPPFEINGVPDTAESLALIVDDIDAPDGTWIHWLIWNIGPETNKIEENSVPPRATEGLTSFNRPGYGGPCPPYGTHRYFFKLYALDTTLDLGTDTSKAELESAMAGHIVARAELIGLYGAD